MTPIQKVLERAMAVCGKIRRSGAWYRCAHPCSPEGDTVGSFAFMETGDGTVLITSHKTGYSSDECLDCLGLTWSDLFPEEDTRSLGTFRGEKITTRYEYLEANGKPVGGVERTEGKNFPQGEYVNGEFKYGLTKKVLPLYQLPYVVQWVAEGKTIYITEGEKDARAIIRTGNAATTKPGGAGSKWDQSHIDALTGANIVIVADNDPAGHKAATAAYLALFPVSKSIKIVEAKQGKDAYDHLQAGFTVEEFVYRTDLMPLPRLIGLDMVAAETPRFLWNDWGYIRAEQCNLLDAKGGTGKTSLSIFLACCGSNGVSPTGVRHEPFSTLYYGNEDSVGEIRGLIDEMGGNPALIHVVEHPFPITDKTLHIVEDDLSQTGARFFVLDAVKYYLSDKQNAEFDAGLVANFYANMRDVARRHRTSPLFVRHFSRNQADVDLMDRGAGLEQWRNSSRSQMVMVPCPHRKGNSMVWHTKGSLRAPAQEPFGCGWANGRYGIWEPSIIDFTAIGINPDGTMIKKQRKKADETTPYWID